jgi:hypothetical protein
MCNHKDHDATLALNDIIAQVEGCEGKGFSQEGL